MDSADEDKRARLLEHISMHPWNWLTGDDIDGRPLVWTKDERKGEYRPFPKNKPYLEEICFELTDHRHQIVIIEKSRQMMVTTLVLLISLWEIMTMEAQRVLLSKITEDESKELLKDKVRAPWGKMPEWLRVAWPITPMPAGVVSSKTTHSVILALAENSADREVRGGGASRVIVDECAFQANTPEIVTAAIPMARYINLISTPMVGARGGLYTKSLIDGRDFSD